jgi:ABC-type lipoprotein release transport system permease subunit
VEEIYLQAVSIALKRYRRDWLSSACSVFSAAAFLVPLLTGIGIWSGVVGSMENRLRSDLRTLEIAPVGHPDLPPGFFAWLAADPDVHYVVPETRSISNFVLLERPGSPPVKARTFATSAGDPLAALADSDGGPPAAGRAPGLAEIYVSRTAADALGLGPGDSVTARVTRFVAGGEESARAELSVLGILPREALDADAALASLDLMRAAELYHSGYGHPGLGWAGADPPPALAGAEGYGYRRFRLYARDMDAAVRVKGRLEARGVSVEDRTGDIARVRSLDRAFSVVILILFSATGAGALASASSGAVAQVAKNRKALACLALLGLGRAHLQAFASVQAALTGLLASVLAGGLSLAASRMLNRLFTGSVGGADSFCSLSWGHLAAASAGATLFMAAASLAAYKYVSDIEPSEGMRDM